MVTPHAKPKKRIKICYTDTLVERRFEKRLSELGKKYLIQTTMATGHCGLYQKKYGF
jgi:hypothetical protein